MIKLILKFLSVVSILTSVMANSVLLYNFSGNVQISDVVDNKLNEHVCSVGKTYETTNGLSIKTDTKNSRISSISASRLSR